MPNRALKLPRQHQNTPKRLHIEIITPIVLVFLSSYWLYKDMTIESGIAAFVAVLNGFVMFKDIFGYSWLLVQIDRILTIIIVVVLLVGTGVIIGANIQPKTNTVVPKYIPIDPKAQYAIKVYNCDDLCQVFVNDQEIPISEVRQGEESRSIDITKFLVNRETKIRFQVVNIGGFITYGFQIRKNNDTDLIAELKCGLVNLIGCDKVKDPQIGVAAEFLYVLTQP